MEHCHRNEIEYEVIMEARWTQKDFALAMVKKYTQ